MPTVDEVDQLIEQDPDVKAALERGETDRVRGLIQQMYKASGLIGEPPPGPDKPLASPTPAARPEEHGLFPSLDPLSRLKIPGSELANKGITGVLSYGDTGPMPGTEAPRPEGDLPVVPRHAQDVVEGLGIGRAIRGGVEFGKGVYKGYKTGPGTTL